METAARPLDASGSEDLSTGQRDRISWVRIAHINLPLETPVSDAKVLTGVQRPLTHVALLFAEIVTAGGSEGLGFSYAKRAGGPGLYAHAEQIATELLGEDPSDIGRLWHKLVWAGASVGRSGLGTQAIAAFDTALWDLKARRARLPLAKLLGAYRDSVPCYNTSGGFLSAPLPPSSRTPMPPSLAEWAVSRSRSGSRTHRKISDAYERSGATSAIRCHS